MQGIWDVLNNPRRAGGIMGIGFIVLFAIAGPILQGDAPAFGDNVEEIRAYWASDGHRYLVGDYLFGIAVIVFFLPFVVALRGALEPTDRSGGMWPTVMLAGAWIAAAIGGAGATALGAIGLAGADSLDDSTLRFATGVSSYSAQGLGFGFAVMLIAAAIVIAQSGALWRWLAALAVVAAVANIVGGWWVPDRDQESVFGAIAVVGLFGTMLWILIVSIQLLLSGGEQD